MKRSGSGWLAVLATRYVQLQQAPDLQPVVERPHLGLEAVKGLGEAPGGPALRVVRGWSVVLPAWD